MRKYSTVMPASGAPALALARGSDGAGRGSAAPARLNYPLYQALGADFALGLMRAGDSIVAVVHDVTAGAVRRRLAARVPPPGHPDFRQSVHRLSDQVLQATLGVPGIAATRG